MLHSSLKSDFIRTFHQAAKLEHPYKVWSDIMTMFSIALENALLQSEEKEQQYLKIASKYEKQRLHTICQLPALIIQMLDERPYDVLGQLYMELEIGNKNSGQFFTPPELSQAIAQLNSPDLAETLCQYEFISLQEPACGSGGMILAFIELIIKAGFDPAQKIWVHATDVDPVVSRMCHIQLSLWNVPAKIVIGNTLTQHVEEVLHTPAFYLGLWQYKSQRKPEVLIQKVSTQTPSNWYKAYKDGDITLDEYYAMKS